MRTEHSPSVLREDYRPPSHQIDSLKLLFELDPQACRVTSTIALRPLQAGSDLVLNGEELNLESVHLDGIPVPSSRLLLSADTLTISGIDKAVVLQIVTVCRPAENTSLSGLYTSNGNFYTQCEAQGFRRITYFPDRPDVMGIYQVTIEADLANYPVLLSNGNLVASATLPGGRHRAVWHDPFPKPSYLFALVAGKFDMVERVVNTVSGKAARLQFYVEPGNAGKTGHAMQALIDSLQWDEQRFGLELDLDRYMVVAVSDFNMGAMENKGLNVFNTKYVFANPQIATDIDYANIESVIGHEYFHNWTGNRVTCRDWFQLTLKEGLTVFRDQEFSADMLAKHATSPAAADSARAVKRIEDVRGLRMAQFPEDAGPMAHPIRPDSYQEINNFYTATVYEKGAEIIRMLQTLVGRDGFRAGMDLYFRRHDGQAVTCDDFVQAIADANQYDLTQFMRWYQQAGTPALSVSEQYDQQAGELTLRFEQSNPPVGIETAASKPPLLIPVSYSLIDPGNGTVKTEGVLALTEQQQDVTLRVRPGSIKPVCSLLRGFSAPVKLHFDRPLAELSFLSRYDSDAFNRWEAMQQLASKAILDHSLGNNQHIDLALDAFAATLSDPLLDSAFKAEVLTLPGEAFLGELLVSDFGEPIDPQAISKAREFFAREFALRQGAQLGNLYESLQALTVGEYSPSASAAAARALKRIVLFYWCQAPSSAGLAAVKRAEHLLQSCNNMTDRETAVLALRASNRPARDRAFALLESQLAEEPLAMDKWFQWQASAPQLPEDAPLIQKVQALALHADFNWKNPNRVRSLFGAFFASNPAQFHAPDGSGYALWTDTVTRLAGTNPQIAARMARALDRWRMYTGRHRPLMQQALQSIASNDKMPTDVLEIVTKALASPADSKNH